MNAEPISRWLTIRRLAVRIARSPVSRLALTGVGVALLIHGIDTRKALVGLREADPRLLLVAAGLTALSQASGGASWGLLVRSGRRAPWSNIAAWYGEGIFAGQVVPAGVGGDLVRGVEVARVAGAPIAVACVAGSRLAGGFAMAFWGLSGVVMLRAGLGPYALGGACLFAGSTVVGAVLALNSERIVVWLDRGGRHHARIATRLRPFAATLSGYGRRPRLVVQVVLLNLGGWALQLAALLVLGRSVGVDVAWQVFAVAIPVTLVAAWIPFVANGIGVKEGILVNLLAHAGVDGSHAASLSFLIDLQMVPFAAAGALVWLVPAVRALHRRGWRNPMSSLRLSRSHGSAQRSRQRHDVADR